VPIGYRLFRGKYAATDATGAGIAGGRWNPKGLPVLYASTTLSLSCLEILVHVRAPRLPTDYVWVKLEIPAAIMSEPLIPDDPQDQPTCCRLGSEWVRSLRSAAVEVPSIIIPTERNLLLNPEHPEFEQITFSESMPFQFDPRLVKLGPAPV
jgi:RES domain-containing protein